jgi:MFS family permease
MNDRSILPPRPVRLMTRDLGLATLGHFLQALGYASLVLLPLYLEHLHATRAEIGLVMALPAVSALLTRPWVAWALDVVGRRPTLIAGTVVLAASVALAGLADRVGPAIYLSRLGFGVGEGVLFAGYFTLASDLIPAERRTGGIALFGVSGLLPLGLNPLVPSLGLEPGELRHIFPWIGLAILTSVACLAMIREPARDGHPSGYPWRSMARELGRRSLRPVWLAVSVFSSVVSVAFAFLTVAAGKAGMPNPALIWAAYAAGAAGIRLLGVGFFDRVGPLSLVVPALAAYLAGLLVAAQAGGESGFLVAGGLAGLGHGVAFPVLTSLVVTRAHAAYRGGAMALMTMLWEVTALCIPPACGAFSDHFGDAPMLALVALSGTLAMGAWVYVEHRVGKAPP